ncbi:hypothetical protein N7493_007952 [Penicillium malachiteum]|uniref:NACHT domain-containing protein n=1 Tax=Penicillium malachiteum TaxID=1324776 RepID=A0AAD6HIJ9_9EURO|nr:hypothetical protein N7493_007952 [Penicillium malachiteum]
MEYRRTVANTRAMMAATAQNSMMAQAVDHFLEDMKNSDRKNPFYEKVLISRSVLAVRDSPNSVQHCTDELMEFVGTLENEKTSSKSYRVLDKLKPFIYGLQGMLDACQAMLNTSPFSVGVAFVGAKVVLTLALKTNSIFEEIFEAMNEIGKSLKCYAKISLAYETSHEVRECLVESYKNIVTFWAKATKLLSQNALVTTLKYAFAPLSEAIGQTVSSLRIDCSRVMDIAQAEEAVRANEDRRRARVEENRSLREGIFSWISAGDELDVRGDLQTHADKRFGGSCSWLFEDEGFRKWADTKSSSNILWYTAPPGSGKTVLSSAVIKHFEKQGLPTAYFFYSFSDFTKRQASTGLRALALQLLNILKTDIPDRVKELYQREIARYAKNMHLTELTVEVLHQLLNQCPLVYVVIDGLDECMDDIKAREMLSVILNQSVYGTIKWFFTSRPDGQIQNMMDGLKSVTISPPINIIQTEIRSFLTAGLGGMTEMIDEVESFVDHSEGSFLYSQFLLDTLRGEGVTCDDDIRRALHEFPKGLTGYYMRTLVKLCDKSDAQQDLVRRIFMILTSAVQSMTWNELRNALAIRRGAMDHSAKLEPYEKQIHELCGSLLIFDRSSKDNEENPKVKFCHKTIADFLKQDPEDLFLDKSFSQHSDKLPKMRKFFIDPYNAATELGLDCLTFLQYDCYNRLDNLKAALEGGGISSAFLKYAAAFWFLHLEQGNRTREVSQAIRTFMQSPNFWTCVAVQSHVVPYVFGRYAETAPGCYQMGLRRADLCEQDSFGVPLPTWLEQQQVADLDRDFCSFVSDWHEVLAFRPGVLSQCVRLTPMKSKLGKNLHQPERVRVWRATEKMSLANLSHLSISAVHLLKGKLFAEMISRHESVSTDQLRYHHLPVFSKGIEIHAPLEIDAAIVRPSGQCNNFMVKNIDGKFRFTAFDEANLQFKCSDGDSYDVYAAPGTFQSAKPGHEWKVIWKDCQVTEHGTAAIFHISQKIIKVENSEEFESDCYSDSDTDSDSDSGSDSDSETNSSVLNDDSGYDEDQGQKHRFKGSIMDWLIVVLDPRRPLWIPISLDNRQRGGVAYAVHPSLPLLVCRVKGQTIHADLNTGKWGTWKELADLEDDETSIFSQGKEPFESNSSRNEYIVSLTADLTELRFSSCGKFLHCLQASFTEDSKNSICQLTFSSRPFTPGHKGGANTGSPHKQEVRYKFCGAEDSLSSEHNVLVYWSEKEVIAALPPLTLEPKLVKFNLHHPSSDETHGASAEPETLQSPIFFPSSTTTSCPVLLYRSRSSADHELFLSLTERKKTGQATDGFEKISLYPASPVIIRWKIPQENGWRSWDPKQDEESEDLKRGFDDIRTLRGVFVDGDKQFCVPVRSGLQWNRKAFLSCA